MALNPLPIRNVADARQTNQKLWNSAWLRQRRYAGGLRQAEMFMPLFAAKLGEMPVPHNPCLLCVLLHSGKY